ncbi:MAG: hypothetical protein IJS19_07655 [Muribaculaceae bacterium]|nr:hypothetical protein [Muribaculaceae bacterium]
MLAILGTGAAYAQTPGGSNYVRDRLGSTRAVITEQGVPLQATDYYPSVIPVETFTAGNAYNTADRLHTGKEFHAFDGLSWHDEIYRKNKSQEEEEKRQYKEDVKKEKNASL